MLCCIARTARAAGQQCSGAPVLALAELRRHRQVAPRRHAGTACDTIYGPPPPRPQKNKNIPAPAGPQEEEKKTLEPCPLTLRRLQQELPRLALVGQPGGAQHAVGQAGGAHSVLAGVLVVEHGTGVELRGGAWHTVRRAGKANMSGLGRR